MRSCEVDPFAFVSHTGGRLEHFPKEGGVLLCSNHIDNLDPPVVGVAAPRPVSFMAKEELFNVPILGKILPGIHAFPVRRGMSDREALRKGLRFLKEGEVLGLFPGVLEVRQENRKGIGRSRVLCPSLRCPRRTVCHHRDRTSHSGSSGSSSVHRSIWTRSRKKR